MRYAFEELAVARVVASTDAPNLASARVLERIGMRRVLGVDDASQKRALELVHYELRAADYVSDGSAYRVER